MTDRNLHIQKALAKRHEMLQMLGARREIVQEAGIPALHRLVRIAQQNTGQSRIVACFLLGLYNGRMVPFNLTELRGLDINIFEDCIFVLQLDFMLIKEIHLFVENGERLFKDLAESWSLEWQTE